MLTLLCALILICVVAAFRPSAAHAKGGGTTTESTNVSIPPEQWFEAIAREQLSQAAYNKAQTGGMYWNMGNAMLGAPQVNYRNPYPATPTGPFEWTHDENQGTSWGRDWGGGNLDGPSQNLLYAQGGNTSGGGSFSGKNYPQQTKTPPWEQGLDPTQYVHRVNENAGVDVWERVNTGGGSGGSPSAGRNYASGGSSGGRKVYPVIREQQYTKSGKPKGNLNDALFGQGGTGIMPSDYYEEWQRAQEMGRYFDAMQGQQNRTPAMPAINNRGPEPTQWAPGISRGGYTGANHAMGVPSGSNNSSLVGAGLRNTGFQSPTLQPQTQRGPGGTQTGGNRITDGRVMTGGRFPGEQSTIGMTSGEGKPPQETPAWQQRIDKPLMQDFGQGLNRMDASLGAANNALGAQGSSLNSATGSFNKAGGYFDKGAGMFGEASSMFKQGNQYAADAATAAKGAQGYFDKSAGSADQMAAPISKLGALGDQMQSTLLQGQLPDSYRQNWLAGNKRSFDESIGSSLNDLASRGVLNSSVTNRSLGETTDRFNESYARNFLSSMDSMRSNYDSTANKYNSQISGLGQQAGAYQGAGQGYLGSANALTSAGQTANASGSGMVSAGQGMLGAGQGHLGVGQGHLGAASGWGNAFQNSLTNAQASMLPYQTRIGGAQEMMGIGDTMDNDLKNLYSMWSSHRYGVPGDTIVSQGGK